jgi:Rieske Fe-S protein
LAREGEATTFEPVMSAQGREAVDVSFPWAFLSFRQGRAGPFQSTIRMERRTFFQWVSALVGSAEAGLRTLPGVEMLCEPLRKKGAGGSFRRAVNLDGLVVGTPRRIVLRDQRVDAWTRSSEVAIGAVWAVRTGESTVDVFKVTCPHLGCPVASQPKNSFSAAVTERKT